MEGGRRDLRVGELVIDYEDRRVSVAGRPVALTVTEFEVLRVLSASAGRVVSYESLLRRAWAKPHLGPGGPMLVRAIVLNERGAVCQPSE